MGYPPLNLFSRVVDPLLVLEVLEDFGDVEVEGAGEDWSRATVRIGGHDLVLTHSRGYYAGPDWPRQVLGMQGYFSRMCDDPEIMRVIGKLRFSVALLDAAEALETRDRRLEVVETLARELDAVVFVPGYLLDASLRVLVGPDGERDEDAEPPVYPDPEAQSTDDEDVEPDPPAAERVARRALVLAAMSARALTELESPANLDDFRGDFWDWLMATGATDECEQDELTFLTRDERPDQQALINAVWRVEGLGVLLWALGKTPLPRYDTLVEPPALWQAVGVLHDPAIARAFVEGATLHAADELAALNTQLLAFHWRMVDFRVRPQAMDFASFSKQSWFGGFSLDDFEIVDGDLALGGERIDRAPPEVVSRASSTAMERHRASNWLAGESAVYSETDVST